MFGASRTVSVEPVGPAPFERYRIIYSVPGLWIDKQANTLAQRSQHVVEITLPPGYPQEKPYCVTRNPVWHPNFGAYICIADDWTPGQTLADVIVQIGDLLQYKAFNVRSPLNAVAAKWALDHAGDLPLSDKDLRGPEATVTVTLKPSGGQE